MSLGIIDRCEQAATAWISKNFHDPQSHVHNKRSQQKSPARAWKRQICSTHWRCAQPTCHCLFIDCPPAVWLIPGPVATNLPGPRGSPSFEISHIPQSVFYRMLWYLITWEKFGTIWKIEKKKHASPVGEMGAGAGVRTGSFMLCLENSCSGEQCIWLKGAPDKAGAWVDAHSPFLFPDWTTVLHIFFLKDILGLNITNPPQSLE